MRQSDLDVGMDPSRQADLQSVTCLPCAREAVALLGTMLLILDERLPGEVLHGQGVMCAVTAPTEQPDNRKAKQSRRNTVQAKHMIIN